MRDVVIAGAARTPMGGFQGVFAGATAPQLGGIAIEAALVDAGAAPELVDEVVMGCVLPAGQGQAPARQAGFLAGLGEEVPATTLNKMCGSGMKAAMVAADQIALGGANVIVAGGMESMTNAPYLLPKMRAGARLGHSQAIDHMFLDGLEDAYEKGRLMGTFAEDCAEAFQFTREAQDEYALASLSRALEAQKTGAFAGEIVPVSVSGRAGAKLERGRREGATVVEADEQPARAKPDKIPHLKPAFRENGTVTPANSSSISDGAAALVLADAATAEARGLKVRARILGHATHAQAPGWFTTAPVPAARKLLDRLGWKAEDVDLWEVNEAFAVVPMAFMREMGLDHAIVNVNGGACALGHPIGASGARIIVTLLNALEKRNLRRGVAAICIGGGEGTAIAIERV
ncbi:acetyl-CoA C-acetyltransferase [Meinhardsimonia xiamenensis]|jgi:acetyl-CoA C-acetyltransferase|uniref:Acetyl-CoA C-acetyltransferase n=1 Tax=Meinhardsimonia xiamenensis TaxID=990712 RepID=A0A1G8YNB8_9RHOB|nr:acetyl-CoA C-acyltransferase [Meinhardsimonia xiamenensis]PRX37369.1 acetyl-CoA C-acetyltransferase [Meinhardsimonia xiamenensis]SDK04226.1 acetyl-CoA C-acetyltransferase [Meinhardsimonia xiamenensis]